MRYARKQDGLYKGTKFSVIENALKKITAYTGGLGLLMRTEIRNLSGS